MYMKFWRWFQVNLNFGMVTVIFSKSAVKLHCPLFFSHIFLSSGLWKIYVKISF